MIKHIVKSGERYGRWVTISKASGFKAEKWECVCDCGTVKTVFKSHLYSGASQSCGCVNSEKMTERNTKHNLSKSKEYSTWSLIKNRCYNENSKDFKDYGERGIVVSEEWLNSFSQFYEDMGPAPDDGQRWSIGRIDNSKGYSKDNCRWETDEQQARNQRMRNTNKSGKTGVTVRVRDGRTSIIAKWIDLNGKEQSKTYSVKKYGIELATRLAHAARDAAIEHLNKMGADYSKDHGK